jgi:pyruvate dehydrogenase E2 component (dihydrolipoamide acetyltransferase)
MAEVIKMPKMSDTMTEGVLAKWHKKVGDKVKSGDVLAEIETDKATMDFESYSDGTLLYIGVEEGKAVPVDALIAVLGAEGEDYKAALEGNAAPAPDVEVKEEAAPAAVEAPAKEKAPKATEDKKPQEAVEAKPKVDKSVYPQLLSACPP